LNRPSTPLSELTRYPGTDEFGILTDPAAALVAAMNGPSTAQNDAALKLQKIVEGGGGEVAGAYDSDLYRDAQALAAAQLRVPSDGYRRFKLARDRDRPLEFDGRVVAEVEESSFGGQVLMRAAIYETRGGKFIAEMTRRQAQVGVELKTAKPPYLFAKATVFDSLDVCAMSFRTHGGRLTEELLRQIGDVDSEFIE
jgi:hypothetical protein